MPSSRKKSRVEIVADPVTGKRALKADFSGVVGETYEQAKSTARDIFTIATCRPPSHGDRAAISKIVWRIMEFRQQWEAAWKAEHRAGPNKDISKVRQFRLTVMWHIYQQAIASGKSPQHAWRMMAGKEVAIQTDATEGALRNLRNDCFSSLPH